MGNMEEEDAERELALSMVLLDVQRGRLDASLDDIASAVHTRRVKARAERAKLNMDMCRRGDRMVVRSSVKQKAVAGAVVTVTSVVGDMIHAVIDPECRKGAYTSDRPYAFPASVLDQLE